MEKIIMPVGEFHKRLTADYDLPHEVYLANTKTGRVFAKVTLERQDFPIELISRYIEKH